MRILFLSARIPYPLDTGGKIRAFNILKALAAQHDVVMLAPYARKSELDYLEHFDNIGVQVRLMFNPDIDRSFTISSLLRSLFFDCPFNVLKYNSSKSHRELTNLLTEGFDIIHCEHLHVAYYARHLASLPLVLDAHNVESELTRRAADMASSPLRKTIMSWHYKKMQKYEESIARIADLILCVSDNDCKTFLQMSRRNNTVLIENGVDTDYFRAADVATNKSIVFVGSMDWRPNVDGVKYFTTEILPRIRAEDKDIKLYIVGRNPGQDIIALQSEAVTVTGTVDDIRPYVNKASVFVVPLRFGGGTRLKILEAFAMEKAVVSTSLGIEGISYKHEENVLIAEDPKTFADSVVRLMQDTNLARSLGQKARDIALKQYNWEVIGTKLLESYLRLESKCQTHSQLNR